MVDESPRRLRGAAAVADDVAQQAFIHHVEDAPPRQKLVGQPFEHRDDAGRCVNECDHDATPLWTVTKKSAGPICPPLKVISIPSAGGPRAPARTSRGPPGRSPIISIDWMPSAVATAPDVSPPATSTRRTREALNISRRIRPSTAPIDAFARASTRWL